MLPDTMRTTIPVRGGLGMSAMNIGSEADATFSDAERDAVYKCIFNRRDVRSQFLPDPVAEDVLARILRAAHHAPSVGFMQPWDFIVVRDAGVKRRVHDAFKVANDEAASMFSDERRQTYQSLKLAGILDAPVGICVTCDRSRSGPVVLGRTHQPEMDLYSAVCAVQNLWLATRAENIGLGWVSIVHPQHLREALGIPDSIVPIAYLCVGHVTHFLKKPELETAGWLPRMPLRDVVWFDQWHAESGAESLLQHL
jgi:5,6-dimethylbenzimidazole synthase